MNKQKSLGKYLLFLVVAYIVLATPWYIPKVVEPLIFGIPLWVFITVIVILIIGYGLVYLMAVKLEEVFTHG